jgi:hypothetical protein
MRKFALLGLMIIVLGGCATSRVDRLQAKSERVEKALYAEQKQVLAMSAESERRERLDHLTQLRALLSAANISLGVVPHAIPAEKRDIAYDVLDEAYDTIQWNIPLGAGEARRPLPSQFRNGVLQLN